MHNMIVEDEGQHVTNWSPENEMTSSSSINIGGTGAPANFQDFFLEGKPTFMMLEPT